MKKFSASVCALAAAALLGSSLSFADERGRNDEYRRDDRGSLQRDNRRDSRPEGRRDARHFDQRDGRWNDRRPEYNARGPEFHRGGHIPREYRMRAYEVDYRQHRLSPPPYGHRWVQVGADYVLIAIASGVIANIILNQ
jgi:Ni/Co efflux regulator RcnB